MADKNAFVRCGKCGVINRIPIDKLDSNPKCGKCRSFLEFRRVPVEATSANFDKEVLSWPGAVLVEFWSPRCGHCGVMAPVIDEIAREKAGRLKVVKVNVDDEPVLDARFGIRGTPMFLIYERGNRISDITGALPKAQLEAWIDASLLGA